MESIFRYLKQLGNELPQPPDVPSVPASTIIAVNRTMESTLSKKVSLELQLLKLQDQVGHRQVRCSLWHIFSSKKVRQSLCIDIR